jgi:hypothetical protein
LTPINTQTPIFIIIQFSQWIIQISYFLNFLRPNPARPTIPTPNKSSVAGSGTGNPFNDPPLAKTVETIINPKIYRIRSTEATIFFFIVPNPYKADILKTIHGERLKDHPCHSG